MELYLIRHADVAPLAPPLGSDEERPLTTAGLEQCKALAAALGRLGVKLEKLYTSPLVRARQTADELVKHWTGPAPELVVADALDPETKPKKRKHFLLSLDGNSVGLVGHEPDLGEIAGYLIGSKKAQVHLSKAGVARVEFSESPCKGGGVLNWLLPPECYRC
jgi:phosphohistidine phosphatase